MKSPVDGDADRQDRGAPTRRRRVASAARAVRRRPPAGRALGAAVAGQSRRRGRAASSTGTATAPRRPRRAARAAATNARLDQWLRWPGVLPRSSQYAPRAMFSPRQSGSRGTETSRCQREAHARHLGDRVLGVGHVLEHLDRARPGRTRRRRTAGLSAFMTRYSRFGALARAPTRPAAAGRRGRCRRSGRRRARWAHWWVSTPSPQPTSSSDVRGGLRQQLVERALEARHEPPDDRVGRAVLVVGVAGDRALGVDA